MFYQFRQPEKRKKAVYINFLAIMTLPAARAQGAGY
jgi:hypothetical protein